MKLLYCLIKADSKKILKILKNIKINDKSLLRVELIKKSENFKSDKIFFQLRTEELIDKNAIFFSDKNKFYFYDFFYTYKKRTGVHKNKAT